VTARRPSLLVSLLVIVALGGGAIGLVVWRDAVYGEPSPAESVLYVRSGETLKRLSLSYAALLADLYWVRAVQYYGGTRLSGARAKTYDQLYPLLDITTSLDPRFSVAYRFGAIFLAEPYPGGAGRPDLAITLLEKGVRANPGGWHYLQDIGFVFYWWTGDFRQAAAYFRKAADVPGAPWWLRSLAAVTLAQGGDRSTSRELWQALRDSATDEWLRNNASFRLAQLDALDAIDALAAQAKAYAARTGTWPASWGVLARAGYLRGMPLDPTGVPYVLDGAARAVTLSPESRLNPLPVGPRAARPAR
jgi:tetratricopeptide (TPR) repeat protein